MAFEAEQRNRICLRFFTENDDLTRAVNERV